MDKNFRKNREIAVQLLYAMNAGGAEAEDSILFLMSVFQVSKRKLLGHYEYAKEIFENRSEIDSHLERISEEYSIDRIAKIDLAILRVILHELLEEVIPVEIAVAEALRIANKYSSFGSGKYLHAMIDSVYKEWKHGENVCSV